MKLFVAVFWRKLGDGPQNAFLDTTSRLIRTDHDRDYCDKLKRNPDVVFYAETEAPLPDFQKVLP